MRKILKSVVYDTDKSEVIASETWGGSPRDANHSKETIYRTKAGQYFIHGQGGPLTEYGEKFGNTTFGSERIWLLSQYEVITWLTVHQKISEIKKYFPELNNDIK